MAGAGVRAMRKRDIAVAAHEHANDGTQTLVAHGCRRLGARERVRKQSRASSTGSMSCAVGGARGFAAMVQR